MRRTAQKLPVSKQTSPRMPRTRSRPRRCSFSLPRPEPCETTRPLRLPWGPCPAPRAELGSTQPTQCCCGQSMTNYTRSPTPLLAKTSRFLPIPEAAPWGPACLTPSPVRNIPGGTPRDRGLTRRGRGGTRGRETRHGPALGAAAPLGRQSSGGTAAAPTWRFRGAHAPRPPEGPGRWPRGSRGGRGTDPGTGGSGERRRGAAAGVARISEQKFGAGKERGRVPVT